MASAEKHVPFVRVDGNKVIVKIGSNPHPMSEEHYISWVFIQTEKGEQLKYLAPNMEPLATFSLTEDDKPVVAFAYCNLHGLWKKEI